MSESTAKPYLEYLDKEMTIMGILSTFAVALPSFAMTQFLGAEEKSVVGTIWLFNKEAIIAACSASLWAALAFYRQRSGLAYWYGQLAISISPAPVHAAADTSGCIESANSWSTWRGYAAGFWMLYLGLYLFGASILVKPLPLTSAWFWAPATVAIGLALLSWWWRQRYSNEDDPEPPGLTHRKKEIRKALRLSAPTTATSPKAAAPTRGTAAHHR